jgi:hypothetical protein
VSSTSANPRRRWLALAPLLCACLFAAWARFSTLDAGLPHAPANDEHVYVWQLDLFGSADPRSDPSYGFYPHLVSRLAALVPHLAPKAPATRDEHLRAASDDFLRARVVVALLSLLALPATWLCARRLLGPAAANLATALVATSVLTSWYATEARPHAALAAFAVASVAAALELQRRGGWALYLATGVLAGLAIATLQSGLACLLPLAVAYLRRPRELRRRELAQVGAALLAALALAWPFYPFLFARPRPVGPGTPAGATGFFGHDLWLGSFDGQGFARLARALWNYDTLTALALLAAALLWLRARRPLSDWAWIAGAFVLPYLVVFGLYRHTFARFALPLLPFAAIGAASLFERIGRARIRALACTGFALLAALPCLALVRVRRAPDTAELAARWIEQHVPRSEELQVLRSLDLPLARDPETTGPPAPRVGVRVSAWWQYVRTHPDELRKLGGWRLVGLRPPVQGDGKPEDPAEFVRGLGAHWLVLEVRQRPYLSELIAWARANAAQCVRFESGPPSAGGDGEFVMHDDDFETAPCWSWRLLSEERIGTPIEIYRLREP